MSLKRNLLLPLRAPSYLRTDAFAIFFIAGVGANECEGFLCHAHDGCPQELTCLSVIVLGLHPSARVLALHIALPQ